MDRFDDSETSSIPPWHLRGRKPPLLPTPEDPKPAATLPNAFVTDPWSRVSPSDPWSRIPQGDPWVKIVPTMPQPVMVPPPVDTVIMKPPMSYTEAQPISPPSDTVIVKPPIRYTADGNEHVIRIPPYGSGLDQYGRPLPAASILASSAQTKVDANDALMLGAQMDAVNALYSNTIPLAPTRYFTFRIDSTKYM